MKVMIDKEVNPDVLELENCCKTISSTMDIIEKNINSSENIKSFGGISLDEYMKYCDDVATVITELQGFIKGIASKYE